MGQTATAAGGGAGCAKVDARYASGNVLPNAIHYPFSSATSTATVVIARTKTTDACPLVACTENGWALFGTDALDVTSVARCTAAISVGNAATHAGSTITATTTVKVTRAQSRAVTWVFGKDEYQSGEKPPSL